MSPDASLQTWIPAIHAGMTHPGFSYLVCERKLMNHFIDQRAGEKMKAAAILCNFILLFVVASTSPAQTNSKSDWEKLVKAAREEGRLTVYGTTIFEDVFRNFFRKHIPRSSSPLPSTAARRSRRD
jgi:hypothetical protein